MACGTGKTFTTYKIDLEMNTKRTLILVPSLYLLSQLYKELSNEYVEDKNVKFILVGSDVDSREPFLSTDRKKIKKRVKDNSDDKIIIISTYQSCDKLKEIVKEYDLIIFDEAHKTVNDGNFSYALYDENIKSKKRLFVTATPKIYNKYDDIEISPDDDFDSKIDSEDSEDVNNKLKKMILKLFNTPKKNKY